MGGKQAVSNGQPRDRAAQSISRSNSTWRCATCASTAAGRFCRSITLISVAGVTVGTAALVIALSLMAGFVEDVRQRIHSGSAHLTVMSLLGDRQFDGVDGLADRLESVPGVEAAGPVLYTPAMLTPRRPRLSGVLPSCKGSTPAAHARVIARSPG